MGVKLVEYMGREVAGVGRNQRGGSLEAVGVRAAILAA